MNPPVEEGETRLGCFSNTGTPDRSFINRPVCPKCGSSYYTVLPYDQQTLIGRNCECCECGWRYSFLFNR